MAIRKSRDSSLVVEGDRADWVSHTVGAMRRAGFTKIEPNEPLGVVTGEYHKATTWGKLEVTLRPVTGGTEVAMHATANVDNIYALFRSPTDKVIQAFRDQLRPNA